MGKNRLIYRFLILTGIYFVYNANLFSQEFNNIRKITVSRGDTTVVTGIMTGEKPDKINPNVFYFWYSKAAIFSNQGGFSGNLIHGEYAEFLYDGKLHKKGYFDRGLKSGKWLIWHDNGTIKESTMYENGLLNGKSSIYSMNGKPLFEGNYSNNLINGKALTIEQDTIYKVTYRKGIETKRKVQHVE